MTDMEVVTQVVLTKRGHGGWEYDISGINDEWVGDGTAPTIGAIFDMAMEAIDRYEHPDNYADWE